MPSCSRRPILSDRPGGAITIGFICTPIEAFRSAWHGDAEGYPTYPSRSQVVDYLEAYAARFDIRPVFNTTVSCIRREGTQWRAETGKGRSQRRSWSSRRASPTHRIVLHGRVRRFIGAPSSTAANIAIRRPMREARTGGRDSAIPAARSRSTSPMPARCRAGGSRCGSDFAARSPRLSDPGVGDPVPAFAGAAGRSDQRADIAAGRRPLRKTGIAPRGQGTAPDGRGGRSRAADRYRDAGQDQGRLDQDTRRYRSARRTASCFRRHRDENSTAIILATGFRPDLRRLIPDAEGVFDKQGMPLVTGRATNAAGLYFCGQIASSTGQLREIGLEARRIAEDAKRYTAGLSLAS